MTAKEKANDQPLSYEAQEYKAIMSAIRDFEERNPSSIGPTSQAYGDGIEMGIEWHKGYIKQKEPSVHQIVAAAYENKRVPTSYEVEIWKDAIAWYKKQIGR